MYLSKNIMKQQKQAITLMELIIVISLILILWLIWFLSLKSYLVSVRDSTRIVELENIETALDSYQLKSWFYPDPTDWVEILYSGWLVWTQWIFSDDTSNIIWYSNNVLDPLTKTPYTYSVKNSRKEFSIAWVLEESSWLVSDIWFISDTYATTNWTKKWVAIVRWNYNWELITVQANSTNYILALPSIVASDLSSNNLVDILNNNKLVYNDFWNLPASYTWTQYKIDSNLDFSANDLIVFNWNISNLKQTYNQVNLLQNLYNAYSWSILWKNLSVNKINSLELFSPEPSNQIVALTCDLINYKLKYFVECGWIDFITFFVVNILHIDISNLPWSKITAVYQASDWTFLFWTNWWIAFYDWTDWVIYTQNDSELVHNQITSVTEDNNWDYWIWTNNWISKLDIGIFTDTSDDIWITYDNNVLVNTHIQYIYTDNFGTVWIWTANWVTSYNWDIWTDYTKQTDWLTHDNITAIYTDSNNDVWFWTNSQWVDKYTLSDWSVTNYNFWFLPDHRVNYIFEDSTNSIWVWTQWWIWKTSDFWTNWSSFTYISTSGWLPSNIITYLFEDFSWNIWVWTEWWLAKYNGSTWINYTTTSNPVWLLWNYIHSIYEDENSNILILSEWWLDTIDSSWNIITWL
jgi:type II secretory pathway pseudopilin PulG